MYAIFPPPYICAGNTDDYLRNIIRGKAGQDISIQSIYPFSEISPLIGDVTADTTPSFTLSASGAIDESAVQLWYQMDTQTGKWKKASPSGITAGVVLGTLSPGTHMVIK